jgi:hypothetical protein
MGRTRQPAGVAALPWNQWQLSRGMGGRLRLESVATLVWNTQRTFRLWNNAELTGAGATAGGTKSATLLAPG